MPLSPVHAGSGLAAAISRVAARAFRGYRILVLVLMLAGAGLWIISSSTVPQRVGRSGVGRGYVVLPDGRVAQLSDATSHQAIAHFQVNLRADLSENDGPAWWPELVLLDRASFEIFPQGIPIDPSFSRQSVVAQIEQMALADGPGSLRASVLDEFEQMALADIRQGTFIPPGISPQAEALARRAAALTTHPVRRVNWPLLARHAALPLLGIGSILLLILLFVPTRMQRRQSRIARGCCPACGYAAAHGVPRCSECGESLAEPASAPGYAGVQTAT